jgi:6-phosphogluconolactonase/glucosamine-6-phosphate isomerase/deaminase
MVAPDTHSYGPVLDVAREVAHVVADRFVKITHAATKTRRHFSVALAAGLNPGLIYKLRATEEQVASRPVSGNDEFDPYF